MPAYISHYIRIKNGIVIKDGSTVTDRIITLPEDLYRELGCNYPKFFKMDVLCKWAWLATELLVSGSEGALYEGKDKSKIAVVLATAEGCLEVDKKYKETISSIPSPALFVYTLPNIMLGEICIRHGFKGEQACMVSSAFDGEELNFWAGDLLEKRGMDAVLCGWVNATGNEQDICLSWVDKGGKGTIFSADAIQNIYGSQA